MPLNSVQSSRHLTSLSLAVLVRERSVDVFIRYLRSKGQGLVFPINAHLLHVHVVQKRAEMPGVRKRRSRKNARITTTQYGKKLKRRNKQLKCRIQM